MSLSLFSLSSGNDTAAATERYSLGSGNRTLDSLLLDMQITTKVRDRER